jgi:hypothetical protein
MTASLSTTASTAASVTNAATGNSLNPGSPEEEEPVKTTIVSVRGIDFSLARKIKPALRAPAGYPKNSRL